MKKIAFLIVVEGRCIFFFSIGVVKKAFRLAPYDESCFGIKNYPIIKVYTDFIFIYESKNDAHRIGTYAIILLR